MKVVIDWYGNSGHCFFNPGTVDKIACGVCGTQMSVRRNVLGPTSWAMAVAGMKRRHDSFTCPRVQEGWHRRIYQLKTEVYIAEIDGAIDYKRKKGAAEKEIKEILKKNTAR